MIKSTKMILITIFILGGILLNAVTDKIYFSDQEIKLEFDNIRIKDIDFYNGDEIIIKYSKKDDVRNEKIDNLLVISSDHAAKIKLELPADRSYSFVKDDANCHFSHDTLIIDTGDEIVKFTEESLEVIEDGERKVIIGEEGILVEDDDERVQIGSEGIIVEGDENREMTGFWGQLLGGFIKAIVKTSISFAGKRPEVIAKYIINDEDNSGSSFTYSLGLDNDSAYDEKETFEQAYFPAANTMLTLDNINGSIKVNQWDEERMTVKVTKKAKERSELENVKIVIEEGSNFTITTEHLKKNPKVVVNYVINIPSTVDLDEVTSSNGYINLEGSSGNAAILTSNGSIEVQDHEGDLQMRTSNGLIAASHINGNVIAVTSNGRIELENVSGSAAANTSNASIEISQCPLITEARTSNARIELELVKMQDDLQVITSNAKILLDVSANLDADLIASTNNGKINWDHPRLNTEKVRNDYLKAKLGKGGYLLDIRTSNANIYLETLEDLF